MTVPVPTRGPACPPSVELEVRTGSSIGKRLAVFEALLREVVRNVKGVVS